MKKNNLAKVLGLTLGASALMFNDVGATGDLKIQDYTSNVSVNNSSVRLIESGVNTPLLSANPPRLLTYLEDGAGNKFTKYVVSSQPSGAYILPLEFEGTIPDGTDQSIIYSFPNGHYFPSNILISSKVQTTNFTNVLDVVKSVNDVGGSYSLSLPNIFGATSGRHGTNTVLFTRKDSSIPYITELRKKDGGLADIVVTNALAGETLTPQYTTNLLSGNWVSETNSSTYVPVTLNNFGVPTSATISNVPASGSSRFYRVKVE